MLDKKLLLLLRVLHRMLPEGIRYTIMCKAILVRKTEIRETQPEPLAGTSSYARKRRARRLKVCHLCGKNHPGAPCNRKGNFTNASYERRDWIRNGKCKTEDTPFEARFGSLSVKEHVQDELARFVPPRR
jgi:hypothetical protein